MRKVCILFFLIGRNFIQNSNSLSALIGTLNGIYSQLLTGDETVRERCIKFLSKKLVPIDHSVIDRAAEDFLILETKKVLQVSRPSIPPCIDIGKMFYQGSM